MARNRDTRAALAALKDRPNVEKRIALAEKMLRDGAKHTAIVEATKQLTGTAIGAGTVTRLRKKLAAERKREERRLGRRPVKPVRLTSLDQLDAAVEVVAGVALSKGHAARAASALVDAGVPFAFDGSKLTVGR